MRWRATASDPVLAAAAVGFCVPGVYLAAWDLFARQRNVPLATLLDWTERERAPHAQMLALYRECLRLRREHEIFSSGERHRWRVVVGGGVLVEPGAIGQRRVPLRQFDHALLVAALRDFGGVGTTREAVQDARGLTWWDALSQDLRYTRRTLGRALAAYVGAFAVVALLPPLAMDADWATWFYRALVLLVRRKSASARASIARRAMASMSGGVGWLSAMWFASLIIQTRSL